MIRFIDLPRAICHHAIGRDHTLSHRMVAGGVIMAIGVSIAQAAGYFEMHLMHYVLDLCGYAVHGLGCVPYIEYLLEE